MREGTMKILKGVLLVVAVAGAVAAGCILLISLGLFAYVVGPDSLPILIDDILAGAAGVFGTIGAVGAGIISFLSFLGSLLADSSYGTITTDDGKCYSYNCNTYNNGNITDRIGTLFDDDGNSYSFSATTYSCN